MLSGRIKYKALVTEIKDNSHAICFLQEDACSQNPLPGFQKLEAFCSVLVELGLIETKLSLTTETEQRNELLQLWNTVEEHDKRPQQFTQLYRTHWGNTLYCRTKRDDLVDAAVIQKLKMAKRYAPAQQDISAQHNRLMYTLVKLLWLRSPQGSRTSPEKGTIFKAYERIQHQVSVEDSILSKAGIPLPKINIKTVRDFIRCQERLNATRQPSTITKTTSSAELPPAPHQPALLPPPDYPLMEYVPTPSMAGTKALKERAGVMELLTQPRPLLPLPIRAPQPLLPLPMRGTHATSTITRPVPSPSSATPETAGPSTWHPTMSAIQSIAIVPANTFTTSQSTDSPFYWSRATNYKRKLMDHPSDVGTKLPRFLQKLPSCKVCGQPTQGHKKFKKKSFCPVKMMSPSKGLDNRVYDSYEQFTSIVDSLE